MTCYVLGNKRSAQNFLFILLRRQFLGFVAVWHGGLLYNLKDELLCLPWEPLHACLDKINTCLERHNERF